MPIVPQTNTIPTSVRLAQLPYFTPQQQSALEQLQQFVSPTGSLAQTAMGQGEGLQNIANPVLQNLQTNTIPNILARFGNRGQEASSSLNRAVASGVQRATSDLFADRANRQGQAGGQLLQFLLSILQNPNVATAFQRTPSVGRQLTDIGLQALPVLSSLVGSIYGGPAGGSLGLRLGQSGANLARNLFT